MSIQVVRVQGFSKGSLNAIGSEVERTSGEILEHRNELINKDLTHLNQPLKATKNGLYGEFKDICRNLNVSNANKLKKNAIAFEGMVITSDKAFFENLGYIQGQEPPLKVKEFFEKSFEFAKVEIGFKGSSSNILSAVVHYDETTPHLQLYYVPVVDSWKDKVYEKDENGKVLKNENGSPIQARDENGKIIYKDVENSEERRLNRTQFWQNKGGQNSYSQLQDRFFEQVSKDYSLQRGEVGVNRIHKSKHVWEKEQLDLKIEPFKKIAKEIEEVETTGKSIPFGFSLIKKQELNQVKNQAKAYMVNRDIIDSISERMEILEDKEKINKSNEKMIEKKLEDIDKLKEKYQNLYAEQKNLNQEFENLKLNNISLKKEKVELENENIVLKQKIIDLNDFLHKTIIDIESRTKEVLGAKNEQINTLGNGLINVVSAIKMLKYDSELGYKADLNTKQTRLINALEKYSSKIIKPDDLNHKISSEIQIEINKLSRDFER